MRAGEKQSQPRPALSRGELLISFKTHLPWLISGGKRETYTAGIMDSKISLCGHPGE